MARDIYGRKLKVGSNVVLGIDSNHGKNVVCKVLEVNGDMLLVHRADNVIYNFASLVSAMLMGKNDLRDEQIPELLGISDVEVHSKAVLRVRG